MPKVSIIIPVYDVAPYLRQCLETVVNQTLHDIEIICVDDGSTDGSAAILAEYAARDARVKVLRHAHTNAGAARNAGMAVAAGEYLGFVDSDDWCDLALFEKAYACAMAEDADSVSFRFRNYDERSSCFSGARQFDVAFTKLARPFAPRDRGVRLFSPLTYAPWGRIVRRALVESEGLRFQEIARTNDVKFCCMVLLLAKRQSFVDEVLYNYRIGRGGNLQAGNAETPGLVFEAWRAVSEELVRRGLREECAKPLISASANSFFYTLNTMATVDSYRNFYARLRDLYTNDALYAGAAEADIANGQTAIYFRMFRASATPFEFLVRQENYYRERLVAEYFARVEAQKTVADQKKERDSLKAVQDALERKNLELRTVQDSLKAECARLQAKCAEIEAEMGALKRRLADVAADADRLKNSESYHLGLALTWPLRKIKRLKDAYRK